MRPREDYSGFFPFGWVRGVRGDNWQILWNRKTGDVFLKATSKNSLVRVADAPDWVRAKEKADFIMKNPDSVAETAPED